MVIAGPTASGKSRCAVELSKRIGGAVVSGDSMQCYRGMDIGTAKTTPAEQDGIRHELIDILDPREPWNVVTFCELAGRACAGILQDGLMPVLAGGTGFYIRALLYGTDFTETAEDPVYRAEMEEYARANGAESLHRLLQETDPVSAERIHANNIRRVIRALEYYRQTGSPISLHNDEQRMKEPAYDAVKFLLVPPRAELYASIDRRVDRMMEEGLLEEVAGLKAAGLDSSYQSMQGIGYKELLDHLDGKCSLEEAVERIKTGSRHYAKRQLTWFRADTGWVELDPYAYADAGGIAEDMEKIVHRHFS